ncbi:alpha/beta hydrolase [Halocatena pleomorpha]|uniref:Alpha/beta hydrolase n=2 Tax=Halocatena pleomorpha TaxID=1785090 RepID=A0A3P3RAP5_9EURY|nr:alpha/beta hydrolase [Halocatena pleomorpha]
MKLFCGLAATGSLAGCTEDKSPAENTTTTEPESTAPATRTTPPSTETTESTTEPTTAEPTTTESTTTETTTQSSGKEVSFSTNDDRTVKGTLYGSGSCAVLFVPGDESDRAAWEPQASTVAGEGHTALTVSLDASSRGVTKAKTVAGAVSYLREKQSAKTVVAVGASSGASAIVRANTLSGTSIDGSAIISVGDAVSYAPELSGRLLFVVGKNDKKRYVQATSMMHQQAPNPKRIEKLPTDGHGRGIFDTDQGSALENMIIKFSNTVCSG